MKEENKSMEKTIFLLCLILIPALHANVLEREEYWKQRSQEFDEYWQSKAKEAEKANHQEYDANPFQATSQMTSKVAEIIRNNASEGRCLRKVDRGPCMATNPIDMCWRCDPNWANNRQKLADCAQGFGRRTTGGKGGPIYVVTDPSDNDMVHPKPGTLRHAVTRSGPLWIIFDRNMNIRLSQELIMTGNKTIDGRGANVHITGGAGITIQFIKNVIIAELHIHDIHVGTGGLIVDSEDHYGIRTKSDGDGISIFGSSNVWIDHVSMSNCYDGLIDAIMGSTAITISNGHFTKHNEVMLFGASDSHSQDEIMQITVAFNHFGKGLIQRMPRCRWGFVHVVNNDYTHWNMYAIGGSQHPTIISEGNRFIAPDNPRLKEVTHRVYATREEWANWQWKSINDEFLNGATFEQSGPELGERPFSKEDMIIAKPGTLVGELTRWSGTLGCRVGQPC